MQNSFFGLFMIFGLMAVGWVARMLWEKFDGKD